MKVLLLFIHKVYSRYLRFFFLAASLLCYFPLFAVKYSTTLDAGTITQYQGPLDNSDATQKLLRIGLPVIAGGGTTPHMTSMTFNLIGNSEIARIELYTTNTTPTFSGPVFLDGVNTPGASVTLTDGGIADADDNATGTHYYWLVINVIGAVTPATKVDASYASGVYVTGPPAFSAGASDPSGFRLTERNYKIGSTAAEHYANLDAAANAIRQFDYDGAADIFMELTANYPGETDTIMFTTHTGPATIIFRPETGQSAKVSEFAPASAVDFITFNGVQKISFDGRPGGAGIIREWTIRNTRTTATIGTTFTFINDANNNTLTYLNIESERVLDDVGIIHFSTTTATTGNDNNTISYSHIRDLSSGGTGAMPRNGITSIGTAAKENSGNVIDNCHFYDIYEVGVDDTWDVITVFLKTANNSWTITNNHFYQTTSYSGLDGNMNFIRMDEGGGYTITGNYIGGTAQGCGGTPFTLSSVKGQIVGINFEPTCSGAANTINNNTISNINFTTTIIAAAGVKTTMFGGIVARGSSDFTIGTSGNGNTIGSISSEDNIIITHNGTILNHSIIIAHQSTGEVHIDYNSIGGITLAGTRDSPLSRMILSTAGTAASTIEKNEIGAAKIKKTTAAGEVTGIEITGGSGKILRNKIIGLVHSVNSSTTDLNGIKIAGTTWDVHNNVIIIDDALNSDINIYGIYDNNSSALNLYHNTVKIDGTGSGASKTAALLRNAAGADNVKNNIFQNTRSGGTGGNYSIYAATSAATYTGDYNYLEVTENTSKTGFWSGTGDRTFALWQTSAGETNSITGTTTLDANGKAPGSFTGANAGTDLFTGSIVTNDFDGVSRDINPWIGAYEGGSASITTSAIAPTTLCRGGSLTISYTITGTYNAGNVFTAQLSNSSGSFAAPTDIGNVTSTTNTDITATIPIGTSAGTGYRIRVVSSDPAVTGSNNGTDLTVPADGGAGTWVWVGGISTSWFDRCNWDKKSLPDADSDVSIPGGTVNDPTITGAAANCKTITIDTGNSGIVNLNSTAGGILNVAQ